MVLKKDEARATKEGIKKLEKIIDEAIINSETDNVTIDYDDESGLPKKSFSVITEKYTEVGWNFEISLISYDDEKVYKATITLQ